MLSDLMFTFSLMQFWKTDVFLFPFVARLTLSCVTLTVLRLLRAQVKEPKVFAPGNMRDPDILSLNWPGCP